MSWQLVGEKGIACWDRFVYTHNIYIQNKGDISILAHQLKTDELEIFDALWWVLWRMFWDDLLKHWKDRLLKSRNVIFCSVIDSMTWIQVCLMMSYAIGCIIYDVKNGLKRRRRFEDCIQVEYFWSLLVLTCKIHQTQKRWRPLPNSLFVL